MLLDQPPVDLAWWPVGSCRQLEALSLRGGHWRPIAFPSYVALVRHPDHGPTLVDTGYSRHFHAATARLPERLYRTLLPVSLPAADELPARLREAGLSPADVQRVVLTHFHGDHASGLPDYPRATVVAGGPGLAQVRAMGRVAATAHGLLPGLLPDDLDDRFLAAESLPRVELDGGLVGRDLLGDRSVVLVDLPGHLPGHLGVLVTTRAGQQVLLAGDAAWSGRAVREDRGPARAVLNRFDDPAATLDTLGRLHRVDARHPDLLVLPAHCAASAAELAG